MAMVELERSDMPYRYVCLFLITATFFGWAGYSIGERQAESSNTYPVCPFSDVDALILAVSNGWDINSRASGAPDRTYPVVIGQLTRTKKCEFDAKIVDYYIENSGRINAEDIKNILDSANSEYKIAVKNSIKNYIIDIENIIAK